MMQETEDLSIENWAVLRTFLPAGWEEMARRSGALRRARDFPDAESLLRVLLLHIGNGCSLAETAVRARYLGIEVSPVAVFKRLRASEEWLRWLAEQLRGQQRLAMETHGRRVRAVDGTSASEPGSTGTDWRVHYAINLADLHCDFFAITSVAGGETLRRVPVRAGDILLGDRIYATAVGVTHVAKAGADIVVRLHRRALPLFDAAGKRVNILRRFRSLQVGKVRQWSTRVRCADGSWISGRLVAVRRSVQSTRIVRARMERYAKKHRKTISPESWKAAAYFAAWTTLPDAFSAPAILELYRLRWQIELAIKRMKSILGLGHLPKKDPASARAWLHGKLFVSLLVERMVESANSFSPWGYGPDVTPQPLARN
jgi:hypothetical protein